MTAAELKQYIGQTYGKEYATHDDKDALLGVARELRPGDYTYYDRDAEDDDDDASAALKAGYRRLDMLVNRTEVSASERKQLIFEQFGYLGFTAQRYVALATSKKRVALGLLAAWAYYLHHHTGMDFVGDAPSKLHAHMAKLQSLPPDKLPWQVPTRRQAAGLDPVDFSSPASWKLR